MQKDAFRSNAIFFRIALILVIASCFISPQISHAETPLMGVAKRYIECSHPSLQAGDAIVSQGSGGYGVEIQGERYYFVYDERLTFSLLAADGRSTAAHIKVDQSPSQFSEQAQWREHWLENIAERSGVPLIRQTLAGNVTLLTANKKTMTGKFAGLSVLIDAPHQVFIQWEWDISPGYAGPQDVAALQAVTWKTLLPCLAKNAVN